jgi:hypothetical protein
MLRSSLDSKHISINKFSRWLRALCTILLARNKQQDRANALSFIEQAVEVIRENTDEGGDHVCANVHYMSARSNPDMCICRYMRMTNENGYCTSRSILALSASGASVWLLFLVSMRDPCCVNAAFRTSRRQSAGLRRQRHSPD